MIGYTMDGLVKLLEIEYGNPDRVKVQFRNDEPEWADITTGPDGDACFGVGEITYSFYEVIKYDSKLRGEE